MKTISDYTIYCTEAQTRKALELGAPIETIRLQTGENPPIGSIYIPQQFEYYYIPTAEQMIGWLKKQGLSFQTTKIGALVLKEDNTVLKVCKGDRKESTLAAIDAALEYLTNNHKLIT